MYNIHCQWHPLKLCMVGRVYSPQFYEGLPVDVAESLSRIAVETEEDLSNIVGTLKTLGTNVLRPILDESDRAVNYNLGKIPKPPVAPRDAHVVIGNELLKVGQDHVSIDAQLESPTLISPFNRSRHVADFPAPSITQLGHDLLVDQQCFSHWELQWLRKKLPKHRINTISIGGHNDASFIILKPGVVISLPETIDWNKHFPGWDVLEIEHDGYAKCNEWLVERKINQGRWWLPGMENHTALSEFVNSWLNNWVGYAAESVFSINALIVNEKQVIINTPRKDVIEFMKKHGIEAIVCPMRHQYFWDNGIHCMTLDLVREGEAFNLFPELPAAFHDQGFS